MLNEINYDNLINNLHQKKSKNKFYIKDIIFLSLFKVFQTLELPY